MEFLHYTPSGNIGKQKPVIENINTNKVHLKKTARAVRNVVKIIRDFVRHLFCYIYMIGQKEATPFPES